MAKKKHILAPVVKKKHPAEAEVIFIPDPPELVEAIRAEVQRRMDLLLAEREKMPPSIIVTKKGIVKQHPDWTAEHTAHIRKFGFKQEEIRLEMKKELGL